MALGGQGAGRLRGGLTRWWATASATKARCGRPPRSPPTCAWIASRCCWTATANRLTARWPAGTTWRRWPTSGVLSAGRCASVTATISSALSQALAWAEAVEGRPSAIICHTVQGQGPALHGDGEHEGAHPDLGPRLRGLSGAPGWGGKGDSRWLHRLISRPPTARRCWRSARPIPRSSCSTRTWPIRARPSRSMPPSRAGPSIWGLPSRACRPSLQVWRWRARSRSAIRSLCSCVSRAYDMIRQSVAYACTNVKLVGHAAGLSLGYAGPSHHALEDIGALRCLPNMTILCPSDAVETRQMVWWMAGARRSGLPAPEPRDCAAHSSAAIIVLRPE